MKTTLIHIMYREHKDVIDACIDARHGILINHNEHSYRDLFHCVHNKCYAIIIMCNSE